MHKDKHGEVVATPLDAPSSVIGTVSCHLELIQITLFEKNTRFEVAFVS